MIGFMNKEKENIRSKVKARKSMLSAEERLNEAEAVFDLLEKTAAFMLSDNILMYHSLPDELPTHRFIDKWHSRKKFFLPRVNGVNLDILPYEKSRLHLGAFNIEEPEGDDPADISDVELIVVPGVAYDRRGNRVGRGKGYYDRLLHDSDAVKIGVAFACQLFDEIDAEPFDVPVDYVITSGGLIKIH